MLDFNSLRSNIVPQIEPQKLFTTLTERVEKFKRPHDEQGDILSNWFSKREQKDLVIKMNTGGGKTVVGLLCLQSSLNEGIFPAIYITPDNNLSEQVIQEAKDLGIRFTTDENHTSFLSGKSILITNISKIFNGKSVFGVDDKKIDIGAIVIDDAHSCLGIVENQFSISLDSKNSGYQQLLSLFKESLSQQSEATLLDIEAADPLAYLTVPYWTWQDKHTDVLRILHSVKDSDKLQWSYPLLKDHINLCSCIFSGTEIEIKPPILPIHKIPSFFNAKRRIYMTATLADDSLLVTHFGANVDSIKEPIHPNGGGDMGNRMILVPQEINPLLSDEELKSMIEEISNSYNVIIIVPSRYRASYWKDIATQVLDSNNISEGVTKLKSGAISNGITILINRYDGIDLPGDACRLLVLDGLPEVYNLHEREENTLLDGTYPQLAKQIQRIEQGMGRGIRSSDDNCAVILLGAKLISKIHLPQAKKIFSSATAAQLDLGYEISKQIENASVKDILDTLKYSLTQNSEWIKTCKEKTLNNSIDRKEPHLDQFRLALKEAYDHINIQQIDFAISKLQEVVNSNLEDRLKGFIKQKLAEIMNLRDKSRAQELQLAALKLNMSLLKPINGIAYSKLAKISETQAIQAKEYLHKNFNTKNDFVIEVNRILSDLLFSEDCVKAFEKAIDDLGKVLGFLSQRPENDFGRGPDNLWSMGNSEYWVIECKSGAIKTSQISKHDINHLSGSIHWFEHQYDSSCTATPIMIHPKNCYNVESAPHPKMRVITSEGLSTLKRNVENYAAGISLDMSVDDIQRSLKSNNLTTDKLLSTITTGPKLAK